MDSTDILITLLSVGMSVVLLFTIVGLFYVVKILRHLRSITEKADHIADNVDTVSDIFRKTAGPAAVSKLIVSLIDLVKKRDDKKE